jgi:hypothetical protein
VEGNVILITKDNGIQLSSGAIVRNNIVIGAASYGIYVSNNQLQTDGVYHDIQIAHNTVYQSGAADLRFPVPTIDLDSVYARTRAGALSESHVVMGAACAQQALSGSQFLVVNNALFSSVAFQSQTLTKTVWFKNAYVNGNVPDGTCGRKCQTASVGSHTRSDWWTDAHSLVCLLMMAT